MNERIIIPKPFFSMPNYLFSFFSGESMETQKKRKKTAAGCGLRVAGCVRDEEKI